MQVDIQEVLSILGAKEIEIQQLRKEGQQLIKLLQELQAQVQASPAGDEDPSPSEE